MGQYYHEDLLGSTYRRREEVLEDFLRRCPDDLRVEEDRLVLRYGGAAYPIAGIRERYVGGQEVVRYYLRDGTYFERWTRQGELIPPWKTNWYQLRDSSVIYPKGDFFKELAMEAHRKVGSWPELKRQAPSKVAHTLHSIYFDHQEGASVQKLRRS